MPNGEFGTSYGSVYRAISEVNNPDGVVVLMDMGAAAMVVKMVLGDMSDPRGLCGRLPLRRGRGRGDRASPGGHRSRFDYPVAQVPVATAQVLKLLLGSALTPRVRSFTLSCYKPTNLVKK